MDEFYVNLKCSSYFEKLNIPLKGLVPGQRYRLSFTESNNATYGMNEQGYGGAIYGFIITTNKTLTGGSIKAESISDGGLIKQFSDRYDGKLNGPRNWETIFTAEDETMYWTWDYGLILDGHARDYNYTNIKLEPVAQDMMSLAIAPIVELSDVTVTGAESIIVGEPCVLTLSGEGMPDILQVDVNGEKYMMSLNGGDIEGFAANMGASVQNDWAAPNDDGSYVLTIPAELVVEGTIITLSGYDSTNLDMITIGTFTPAA